MIFSKMKSVVAAIAAFALVALLGGCAERNPTDTNPDARLTGNSKVLVAYFTWSGHLKTISHWIADETGADYIRVLANDPYPTDYGETADRAKVEKEKGVRPAINVDFSAHDFSQYETIFVGFPIWWYDLPMPMWTFLENMKLEGKTVIPFFSHEGTSDGSAAVPTVVKLAKGANVKAGEALSIRGSKTANSEEEVRAWVKKLGVSIK